MSFNLTEEQQAAVSSPARRLLVTASAGSGKTTVLVERYLRLVFEHEISPASIWAVTFTRKSAAEMRKRILSQLREAGRFELVEQAETASLGTIDSLSERLLRENAIEAGLDPDFEIQGDDEQVRAVSEAVKFALGGTSEEVDTDGWEAEAAGKKTYKLGGPHAEIRSLISEILDKFRNGRMSVDELESRFCTPKAIAGFWRQDALAAVAGTENQPPPKADADDFWTQLRGCFAKCPKWLAGEFDHAIELRASGNLCRIVHLACKAWRNLETEMLRQGKLDFSLQARLVLRLLTTNELVRNRLAASVRAVMIDEAQDLNPLQFLLLQQLRSSLPEDSYFLFVGDVKQSIYGFRQAAPGQLDQLGSDWTRLSLSKNHRSTAGIQHFVDAWAEQSFPNYAPMLSGPRGTFDGVTRHEVNKGEIQPQIDCVAEWIKEGLEPRQIAVLSNGWVNLDRIGKELGELGIRCQLPGARRHFHTHMVVRELAATLRALADSTDNLAYLAMLRSPVVGISLDGIFELCLLKPKGKTPASFIEWMPSDPVDHQKMEQFSEWFEPLQKDVGRLPAWQTLGIIFAESGYLERIAVLSGREEALANSRKLYRIACDQPLLSAQEFALQVQQIAELQHRSTEIEIPDSQSVTLSTIHSAKGLEFDAVVIADLPDDSNRREPLLIDLISERISFMRDNAEHPYHKLLSQVKADREAEERRRLTYVALTRAKSRLAVFCLRGSEFARKTKTLITEKPPLKLVTGGMSPESAER